jgi:quercetin dioxygenase-like cupin family protein
MQVVNWSSVEREKIAEGVERRVIWGAKGTTARFAFARGTHVSAHAHEAEQHTCLLEGAMRVRAAGREFEMRGGSVLVIPPQVEHEVWFLEDSVVLDFFSPPRDDWRQGRHAYLRGE